MSHAHAYRQDVGCVEVGPTVCLQPISGGGPGISRRNDAGELEPVAQYFAGFLVAHDRAGFPHRCEGFVAIAPEGDRPVWSMTGTLEGGDLTLDPSILCTMGSLDAGGSTCGFHGWVRNGKWEGD